MKDEIIGGLLILGIVGFLFLGLIGSSLNLQSHSDGKQYLKAHGFKLEEMRGYEVYGSWFSPKEIRLRYPKFVEKAKEEGISTIHIEYTDSSYDYDFWFYANGIRYEVWEKHYVPNNEGV